MIETLGKDNLVDVYAYALPKLDKNQFENGYDLYPWVFMLISSPKH